jgi:predicted RNase H-like HicB family nuclease
LYKREDHAGRSGNKMNRRLTLIYWKSDKFWLGKLLEYPEIMTQGETLEDLEDNIKEAYLLMAMDDVPDGHQSKEIVI